MVLRGAGGLALTTATVLYALRANIIVLYPPARLYHGKRETRQLPAAGQRLRVGGMVMPGSVRRDPSLKGELQPLRRRGR